MPENKAQNQNNIAATDKELPVPMQTLDSEERLLIAKMRFLAAADDFSPMGIVQRRPLTSVGIAFILGAGLAWLGRSSKITPVVGALAQMSGLMSQLVPLISKRARSSGG